MIYKGKKYVEIDRDNARVGDLLHITEDCGVCGESSNFYEFILHFDEEGDPRFDTGLPNGTGSVTSDDTFTVYKYLYDVNKETQGVYVVASEILDEFGEDIDLDLFILDTKEEAQQHVKDMGKVTRIRHRSTDKREVFIQEVGNTTKEIRIYHVEDYNPNRTLVL